MENGQKVSELESLVFSAPSTSIPIFFNPQMFLCGFKNFHAHTYPYSNRICPSTRIRIHSQFVSQFVKGFSVHVKIFSPFFFNNCLPYKIVPPFGVQPAWQAFEREGKGSFSARKTRPKPPFLSFSNACNAGYSTSNTSVRREIRSQNVELPFAMIKRRSLYITFPW